MHMLLGVHYAYVPHMQITWYCLYIIFSRSKFPTQYDRLSQQQLGFLL